MHCLDSSVPISPVAPAINIFIASRHFDSKVQLLQSFFQGINLQLTKFNYFTKILNAHIRKASRYAAEKLYPLVALNISLFPGGPGNRSTVKPIS